MLLSLAYEGLPSQELTAVVEALGEVRMRATFFVNPPNVLDDLATWHAVAAAGHEIANAALSGVSLSGELINWTKRMVEQDLHMTQSFLEDVFSDRVVPVFAYPGPFTRCSDGDYRDVVESIFALSVTPGDFEKAPSSKSMRRIPPQEWTGGEAWAVVRGPRVAQSELATLVGRIEEMGAEVLPVFEAAQKLGRVAA